MEQIEPAGLGSDGDRLDFGRADRVPDTVAHADALAAIAAWRPGSLDAIYLDPPFATGTVRRGRGFQYDDREDDPAELLAWLAPHLAQAHALLAPTGSLFLHLDYRTVHYAKVALDRIFGRARFINEIIWCYAVGGKSRRGFGRKHDTILWYARSADHAFYPEAVRVARRGGSHMRVVLDESGAPVQEKTDRRTGRVYRYPVAAGKVPEDWWTDIETLNHSDRERLGWPSQKPERLLERLLGAVTQPGDRVADWFCGSGTTGAVAQRLGRRFDCVDREAGAVEVTVERLRKQGLALAAAGSAPVPVIIHRAHFCSETCGERRGG
ncbi:MAG: site-specific DNA-methyltransferase [Deltaproteobacteria bacterium]|nr:site-specific DNA-methyltransferase [Deltaproteobacteria bacterium]